MPLHLKTQRVLYVGALHGAQPPRRHGVRGLRLGSNTVVDVAPGGFSATDAASTWCQLSTSLTRSELVAAGDFIISGLRLRGGKRAEPLCSIGQLVAAVEAFAPRRGVMQLRAALPLLRSGVDSPQESLLRLLLVDHGFAEPVVALPIRVEHGALTLHPDLAWPDLRILFEYEGDGHRVSAKQFRHDIRRREMFEAAGWRVIRVTSDDLTAHLLAFIARVTRIVAQRRTELSR